MRFLLPLVFLIVACAETTPQPAQTPVYVPPPHKPTAPPPAPQTNVQRRLRDITNQVQTLQDRLGTQ